MNEEFFIQNGLLKKISEPSLNTNNRAFLYGDGFFESIYAFNQKLPILEYHLIRLNKAFDIFNFEKLSIFDNINELSQMIFYLARKNKLYKAYRVRISIYRSLGGLYKPNNNKANYVIHTSKLPFDKFFFNNKGLKIDVFNGIYKNSSIISPFKIISPNSVIAMNFAKDNKLDDIIFLNYKKNIVETSNSNIFIYANNQLITPKLTEGCVDGIMRHIIILVKNLDLEIIESEINVHDMLNAQEIILTNAVSGIRFVSVFRTKRYLNFMAKMIFEKINKLFFS